MNLMSFEKFREETLRQIRLYINDEAYIQALEPDLLKSYNELVDVSEFFGEDQISPDGYALGIAMLYPDLP